MRKLSDMMSRAHNMGTPSVFMRYNGGAEKGVDHPTLSSKILSTFSGRKSGRE